MTLASIALHFRPIHLGSRPNRQPPPNLPSPFPSPTNEKDISRRWEGRPSRLPWPLRVCSPSDRFWCVRGGWFPGQAVRMGRTDLSYSITSLEARGDNLPFLHPTPPLALLILLSLSLHPCYSTTAIITFISAIVNENTIFKCDLKNDIKQQNTK